MPRTFNRQFTGQLLGHAGTPAHVQAIAEFPLCQPLLVASPDMERLAEDWSNAVRILVEDERPAFRRGGSIAFLMLSTVHTVQRGFAILWLASCFAASAHVGHDQMQDR